MITVKGLLKSGLDSPVMIAPTDTVFRALQLMVESKAGSLAVTGGGCMVGIFTEDDFFKTFL